MNKTYTKWWHLAILMVLSFPVFSQKYSIHLAAFTQQIEPSFFNYAGFSDVQHQQTLFNFHEYTWGSFATLEIAKKQLSILQQNPLLKGLNNLSVMPMASNFTVPTTDSNMENLSDFTDFQIFSRSVYINPKTKALQKIDVAVLEEVASILTKYPDLKLRILAINKTAEPVDRLGLKMVENFLLAQNIPAYRIKTMSNQTDTSSASNENKSIKNQQVILTLVDLKEEIILDKFGNNGLIVKESIIKNSLNLL